MLDFFSGYCCDSIKTDKESNDLEEHLSLVNRPSISGLPRVHIPFWESKGNVFSVLQKNLTDVPQDREVWQKICDESQLRNKGQQRRKSVDDYNALKVECDRRTFGILLTPRSADSDSWSYQTASSSNRD
eukprot:GHVP01069921.1.p1 GENE.GHVP01069921.1~~GHVP01069921.1.p1  ORF type:complete len:130 (+),score=21.76 GHVP01069921.1:125-514(+)